VTVQTPTSLKEEVALPSIYGILKQNFGRWNVMLKAVIQFLGGWIYLPGTNSPENSRPWKESDLI
jgi:hypothetical protein